MKKFATIFFAIATFSLFCIGASAYGFSVDITETEAYVSSKSGATFVAEHSDGEEHEIPLYEEIHLDYNTSVTVTGEATDPELLTLNSFDTEGKDYVQIKATDKKGNERTGYVEVKNISAKADSFKKTDGVRLYHTDKYHVMIKEGIKIYSGPSKIYEELGTIPYEADFNVTYGDVDGAYVYGYTEYNGIKGWVYTYPYTNDCPIGRIIEDTSFYTGKLTVMKEGIKLFDLNQIENDKYKIVSDEIPVGTELEFKYFCSKGSLCAAYVSYNGTNGWIYFDESYDSPSDAICRVDIRDIGYVQNEIPLYSDLSLSKKTGKVLPANSAINIDSYYFEALDEYDENTSDGYRYWIEIEYEGKNYWITTDGSDAIYKCNGSYVEGTVTDDEIPVYTKPNSSSTKVYTIKESQTFNMFMYLYQDEGYWNYVVVDGVAGWAFDEGNYSAVGQSAATALRLNYDGTVEIGVEERINTEYVPTTKSASTDSVSSNSTDSTVEETTTSSEKSTLINGKVIIRIIIAVVILGAAALIGLAIYLKKRDKKEEGKYKKIK